MELESRQSLGCRASRALGAALLSIAVFGTLAWSSGVAGEENPLPPNFPAGVFAATERATVKAAIDGDTVSLADGRSLRLVDLDVPREPEALASAGRAALSALVDGSLVILGYAGQRRDRYGRVLAQLYRADGLWLQGELLARGLARVASTPDNRALVPAMLERERAARAERRGLWTDPAFAVLAPAEARRHLERFALVEGTVETVAQAGNRGYLHFGPDPRTGFTAVLLPESRRLLNAAGHGPDALAGQRVRVRGFIRWWNGPIVEVTHPEQIELVAP